MNEPKPNHWWINTKTGKAVLVQRVDCLADLIEYRFANTRYNQTRSCKLSMFRKRFEPTTSSL